MQRGVEIAKFLRVLRQLLGVNPSAMARALNVKAGTYTAQWEVEGRGTFEETVRPHIISLVNSLEIPAPDEKLWVDRIMGFLFGRVALPWDGDPPKWRVDPRRKPGRKSGAAHNAKAEYRKAVKAHIDRLADWSLRMMMLGDHANGIDYNLVKHGAVIAADLKQLIDDGLDADSYFTSSADAELAHKRFLADASKAMKRAEAAILLNSTGHGRESRWHSVGNRLLRIIKIDDARAA